MAGNHTATAKYLRATNISGNVYELNATAGAAANNTTVARYVAGGTTSNRVFHPTQTSTANEDVFGGILQIGWREAAAQDASNQITFDTGGTITIRLRYRRSGQALEVDQSADLFAGVYHVNSAGTLVQTIDTPTLGRVTFTTTTQTLTFNLTWPVGASKVFAAGDKFQIEIGVETLLAGIPTPPVVATDLWLVIEETEANSGAKVVPPNYAINYVRTLSVAAVGAATLARVLTLFRTLTAAAVGVLTVIRQKRTTLTAAAAGVASIIRQKRTTLTAAAAGVASMVRQKQTTLTAVATGSATLTRVLTLFRTLTAAATGSATLAKLAHLKRTLTATAVGTARGYVTLLFEQLPGSVTTVIRRIYNTWQD